MNLNYKISEFTLICASKLYPNSVMSLSNLNKSLGDFFVLHNMILFLNVNIHQSISILFKFWKNYEFRSIQLFSSEFMDFLIVDKKRVWLIISNNSNSLILFIFCIAEKNRTDQCNPTHKPSGQGHTAGYAGKADKPDLNNHGNQKNPNNAEYKGKK